MMTTANIEIELNLFLYTLTVMRLNCQTCEMSQVDI